MASAPFDPATAVQEMLGHPAWAVIRRGDGPTATLLGGVPDRVGRLGDVPLETGPPPSGRRFDRLLAIPFRQVAERGFAAHDDAAPLTAVRVQTEIDVSVPDLLHALPSGPVHLEDPGGFDTTDQEYAATVRQVLDREVGRGEAANLVIARHYRARVRDWGAAAALRVFRRLMETERGAYWTFCCFTGDRYLIGASPERHISLHGQSVRMNPISGTFRLGGLHTPQQRKQGLLDFLADPKEIFELFMVVDEELKMMCDVCSEGGQVLGPFLKAMRHLVHTEYLLAGRSSRDVREVLRDTMYAATVTGSPVENACDLITRYEPEGRGYYGAALALLGRDPQGQPTADSPILIRTADVSPDGQVRVTAGATLVRDSDPDQEVAETHAKAAGVLGAFGLQGAEPPPAQPLAGLIDDDDVQQALARRNRSLSQFWLVDQQAGPLLQDATAGLRGRTVAILDGADAFCAMLRHVLSVLGLRCTVVRHEDYKPGLLDGYDLAVVGPGPGDPRDEAHPKIRAFGAAVDDLLESGQPFLAVCLGHQVLCGRLGLALGYKDVVFQGTQSSVTIDGQPHTVGFYNTFVARSGGSLPEGVTVEADPESGDVHLLWGPHYTGVQFHTESILTEEGHAVLASLLRRLLD